MRSLRWMIVMAAMPLLVACSDSAPPNGVGQPPAPPSGTGQTPKPPTPPVEPTPEPAKPTGAELIARGKSVYMSNCIACHNMDPAQDGALGPAVAGSSHELLEARVIHGTYPDGYKPKRDTNMMIPLPHLEKEIAALTAYLNQG